MLQKLLLAARERDAKKDLLGQVRFPNRHNSHAAMLGEPGGGGLK